MLYCALILLEHIFILRHGASFITKSLCVISWNRFPPAFQPINCFRTRAISLCPTRRSSFFLPPWTEFYLKHLSPFQAFLFTPNRWVLTPSMFLHAQRCCFIVSEAECNYYRYVLPPNSHRIIQKSHIMQKWMSLGNQCDNAATVCYRRLVSYTKSLVGCVCRIDLKPNWIEFEIVWERTASKPAHDRNRIRSTSKHVIRHVIHSVPLRGSHLSDFRIHESLPPKPERPFKLNATPQCTNLCITAMN